MADKLVAVRNLGRMSYGTAVRIMTDVAKKKLLSSTNKNKIEAPDTLLMVEHNPVYTIGTRSSFYLGQNSSNDEKIDERLKRLGAEFYVTNRGGLITFHGPGQLVCYPILNLKHYKPSVRWYINLLEQVVIETCKEFSISVGRTEDIGVWIGDRKIAAIGVHVSKYITTHGLALNCNTDLKWFDHIVPCGIHGKSVTSLSNELGTEITVNHVLPVLLEKFKDLLQCQLYETKSE